MTSVTEVNFAPKGAVRRLMDRKLAVFGMALIVACGGGRGVRAVDRPLCARSAEF